ncbi:MAG: chemotaxis protein CheW [Anaerolineae bacterium]|nr:chemotaxis protein CheW [Anaerolineae bacterium]
MNRSAWDELRAILRETSAMLNRDEDAGSLEQRTHQLARPITSGSSHNAHWVLTFALGTERYGWPVHRVRAIGRIDHLTPVPTAPAYYPGVLSLRGQVLSVMDLRVYLGLPPLEAVPEFMIVIDGADLEIGVLATEVFDVLSIPLDRLTTPSSAGLDLELVIGVTTDGLTILDAEALLRRERARVESEKDR